MTDIDDPVIQLLADKAVEHRDEPFKLASGQMTNDYIDGKFAVSRGADLDIVCSRIVTMVKADYDAVGGLTMGADALAHGIALASDSVWFTVRKEQKKHGRGASIEGGRLSEGDRVLLVDDIVTTGRSIEEALRSVQGVGAVVVWAVTLVDRGDTARALFESEGIPYTPIATYADLGIDPVAPPG